ncbi:MAG TPA: transcription termination factor Rho, partial [Acidimicrobiales bacterium]|nr:transcription termination factor Rho [Acidimicrobiales bacterium]
MAAEPQLERSVLERKEREELRAIAQAMALETNTRSKKADIIDQILRAAGVDADGATPSNGDSPARSRPRRPAAADVETDGAVVTSDTAEPSVGAPGGDDIVSEASSNGSHGPVGSAGVDDDAGEVSVGAAVADAPADRPGGGGQARQTTQPRPGGGNDPGNRRSRRRRGRERTGGGGGGGGGGERELQGGGQEAQYAGELIPVRGLLDLRDEGYGFVRADGYLPSPRDVYVSISQARRFALRKGDYVEGASRPAASNEKFPALIRIDSVCGLDPEQARSRPKFEDLTPLFPDSKLRLETTGAAEGTTRIIDLLSPIGKGQRGLIVSPPKAGKTTVMKQIAHSIGANNPEVHLMVLLVDERPEEVTDMRR